MALIIFIDDGNTIDMHLLGVGCDDTIVVSAVELTPSTLHTVLALVPDCVLLEIKAGLFDPKQPKDLAPWAPVEADKTAVRDYQVCLFQQVQGKLVQ
jgi:cupin fold WbuC family metalloprotein